MKSMLKHNDILSHSVLRSKEKLATLTYHARSKLDLWLCSKKKNFIPFIAKKLTHHL